jgi:2-keto-4-pentenoate hydratase/2-oxohepta-3-ene-1,7-dioic acid hydratase in catechol pathway
VKLISYGAVGAEQPGVLVNETHYVPLAPLLAEFGVVGDMNAVVGLWPLLSQHVARYIDEAEPQPLAATRLGPPVPRPRNIIAVGANTHSHVAEASKHTGGYVSKIPMLITKAPTSLCGPADPIRRPAESKKLDYETELAVVIGRAGRNIPVAEALDYVAGYMACSDVTARDVQTGEGEDVDFYWQHYRGKSFETFCPTGPWLLTADEVPDLGAVKLQSYVNDEVRQNSDLSDLVFDIPSIISAVSSCVPLRPGDILVTGSPAGVGHFMDPPGYLEPGDVLRTVVPPVGELANPIVG